MLSRFEYYLVVYEFVQKYSLKILSCILSNNVPLCVHISINNQWIVWYVQLNPLIIIQVSNLYRLRKLKIKSQLYHQVQVAQ